MSESAAADNDRRPDRIQTIPGINLQLADFIGLDVCLSILNVMYDGFKNPKYAPCPLLVNMVMAKKFGIKSGEGFYDYSESKKAEKVSLQFKKH